MTNEDGLVDLSLLGDEKGELNELGQLVYLSGSLSLWDQFTLWSWRHKLIRKGAVGEQMAHEATLFLELMDEYPQVRERLFDDPVGLVDRINEYGDH